MRDIILGNYIIIEHIGEDEEILPLKQKEIHYNNPIVYEVLRIHNSEPVFLTEHVARLNNSCQLKDIPGAFHVSSFEFSINELIRLNNLIEGNVKIVYDDEREYLIYYFVPHVYPTIQEYDHGVKLISLKLERDSPNIKLQKESYKNKISELLTTEDCYEIMLRDDDDYITEGSKSNIFFIKDDQLFTTPDEYVLKGITRDKVIDIATSNQIPVRKTLIPYSDLSRYNAAFITGTSPKVLPVRLIDEVYDFDVNHPLLRTLMKAYDVLLVN